MNNAPNSACILIQGPQSQCVAHSLNLIGTLLNSCPYNLDKSALLICTRHSWEESLKLVKGNLVSLFHPNHFLALSQVPDTFLTNLFLFSLGPQLQKVTNYTGLEIASKNEDSLEDSSNQPPTSNSSGNPGDQGKPLARTSTHLEPNNFSGFLDSEDTYEESLDTMKRLFIRFIDEPPSRKVDDQTQESPPESSLGAYWNFIRSSSEIATDGNSIEYVFVAGLSEFTLMNPSCNYQNPTVPSEMLHPFTAFGVSEDNRRVYHNKAISMYTLSLSLSLNALRSRVKDSSETEDPNRPSFPRFFLFESLPLEQSDADKFTRFISERFNLTYLLPTPLPCFTHTL